jgi:hypothetical protein
MWKTEKSLDPAGTEIPIPHVSNLESVATPTEFFGHVRSNKRRVVRYLNPHHTKSKREWRYSSTFLDLRNR